MKGALVYVILIVVPLIESVAVSACHQHVNPTPDPVPWCPPDNCPQDMGARDAGRG